MTGRDAALNNRLARSREELHLELGPLKVSVRLFGPLPPRQIKAGDSIDVALTLDGRPGRLLLSPALAELLISTLDEDLQAEELDQDSLALLLELALAPVLDRIQAATGQRIALLGSAPSRRSKTSVALAVTLHLDGRQGLRASLVMATADGDVLARACQAWPRARRSWSHLRTTACLRLGSTRLKLRELRSLRLKDVVLFDEAQIDKQRLSVVVGEHWSYPAEIEGTRARVLAGRRRLETTAQEQRTMADTKDATVSSETVTGTGTGTGTGTETELDDLPITLVFELGRQQLSLGELREIDSGHVFDLGRGLDDPVDIYANGSLIGRGEVMQVAETLGVRIVRLFSHE